MVVHPEFNDHLHIHKLMHKSLLFSLSKKQQNGKVSLNNTVLRVDYKLTINMLMKYLYIAEQYFYINNQFISGKINRAIYKPTKTTTGDYLAKTIQGKLIDINTSDLNKMSSTKRIVSKQVRL